MGIRRAIDKGGNSNYGSPPPFLLNNPLMESNVKLFRDTSAFSALSTLVRQTDDGDATDSRPAQAAALVAAGPARQAVHDADLDGFVSDPADFAAAVSGIAGASLPHATIESLLAVTSIRALRKLAKDFDAAAIETGDPALRAFLDEAARVGQSGRSDLELIGQAVDQIANRGPNGRAWTMLVAGHLSLLRADQKVRPLIYPANQKH